MNKGRYNLIFDSSDSGVTGGGGGQEGRVPPPQTSDREMCAEVSGKERQGKK